MKVDPSSDIYTQITNMNESIVLTNKEDHHTQPNQAQIVAVMVRGFSPMIYKPGEVILDIFFPNTMT